VDFNDNHHEAEFRAEVRSWLADNVGHFVPAASATDEDIARLAQKWQAALADAGYAGFGLPGELGGRPGPLVEQVIFAQEVADHPMALVETMTIGPGMAIPTIMRHGTSEQLEKLARATIRGEILWCQLFSEPGAGSDLAGVRTTAVADGDRWVLNGQKVWTSGAEDADWGLLLARSDPTEPKHAGLTYFLVDMHTPGITVRPLRQLGGRSEFNEVFFDDVHIADTWRVGPVNGGWKVAITTLSNERLALAGNAGVGRNVVAPLLRLAKQITGSNGRPLIEDLAFRAKLASYQATVAGIDHIGNRILTALSRGENPGAEATIGKMTLTRLLQELSEFGMDLAGVAGGVVDRDTDPDLYEIQQGFFLAPGYRMGGGTEEIGKNIIAERVLGLPPEFRPDKGVSFNQIN
jgi:alkylation response protein AidB-like acyl-CoA dehydrogenase